MTTRFILTIAIFQLTIWGCYAVNGVIWCKQQQEFVQLFSIPEFAALKEENLAKHREMQDMRGEIVKAVYYEEKSIVMFYDNDTKVTGIHGELWNLLADYLNFTFIPIKYNNRYFDDRLKNGTQKGLLGLLERDEAQVIMRSEFYPGRLQFVDYTTPLWKSKFHIYVQPTWLFDNKWIFMLLSWKVWFYILFLFMVLSCVGYFLQKVPMNQPKYKRRNSTDFSINDHFFYSFTIMSARGYIPDSFYNKFKILSLSKSIFAWLILVAFSSHLTYRMINRKMKVPFEDIESLIHNTKYILLSFRGTFLYNYFKQNYKHRIWFGQSSFARVRFMEIAEDMHNIICNDVQRYAVFEIEDRFMAMNDCPLQATGNYNDTWITFAIQKNYPYKKIINSAIIKLREVGLLNNLRYYWFNRIENTEQRIFKTIDLQQVYLIFLILSYGMLISLVILVVENITHYYEMKNARQYKRR